ncbi:type II toxin-antitoxin system HicB family antitoxin [Herbaspirillum rubrisubalbicans]|uniref:CopG family transcriptional regulator n=1 Tax=Herbaspirillum rubrisubalbicans TaxID=80842 RepID=A0AAD0U6M4_9BURK|nr:type II toxin-antitoxin system HicB family antitoxin [Herbaspirillum rubrisubalbicans]AYR24074.1 CopG family transcriptional regulator [Herbaspirillum rubrisubalbicans]
MLYAIYVHKDAHSAYGATFPDFPGCFAGADELQLLPAAAQEAVEAHFHGEAEPIPSPSAPEDWADDEHFQGGYWMLVEIDLSRVNAKAVRLNVSLPQGLVTRIDAVAQARRMSRSAFLALAAEHEMQAGSRR